MNGNNHYGKSGFKFSKNKVVAWNSNQADILAAGDQIKFFLQYPTAPYNNPKLDKNGRSGIVAMGEKNLNRITECPESGYSYHWVEATPDETYCVRTRDGEHYAKIQVTYVGSVTPTSIEFDWVYQPKKTRKFDT
jgi:hypothetical protein